MENWKEFVSTMLERMGFTERSVEIDPETRHGTIFIHDHPTLVKENLPLMVKSINHVAQLVAKKNQQPPVFFDINNYRREREGLITELARAAARKVVATKEAIPLPAMNAYERRIVHLELAAHPDVRTESAGAGAGRYVIVKLVAERSHASLPRAPSSSEQGTPTLYNR